MSQLFRLKNGTVLLSTEAPGGIYNSGQLKKIAELCSKELAIVKATEDQRLALFVKESEVENVAKQLRAIGLGFRHYQDSLHQPISCLGELCEEHEQPAMATAMDITKEIASIELDAPLKIGINGCARCCTPCHTLDIAVVGDASGYRISLGGKTQQMPEFASYFAEGVPPKELPKRLKAVIETFKNLADTGESLHDVIERCGVTDFVKALAPYSQDAAQREDPFAPGAAPVESVDDLALPMDELESLDELETPAETSDDDILNLDDDAPAADLAESDDLSIADDQLDVGVLDEIPIEKTGQGSLEDDLSLGNDDVAMELDDVSFAEDASLEDASLEDASLEDASLEAAGSDELNLDDASLESSATAELDDLNLEDDLLDDASLESSATAELDDLNLEDDLLDDASLESSATAELDGLNLDAPDVPATTPADMDDLNLDVPDDVLLGGEDMDELSLEADDHLSFESDAEISEAADMNLDSAAAVTEDDIDLDAADLDASDISMDDLPEAELDLEDDLPEDLSVESPEVLDDADMSLAESPVDEDLEGIPELDDDLAPEELTAPISAKAPASAKAPVKTAAPAVAAAATAPKAPAAVLQDDFGEDLPGDMPELSDEEENQFEQKLQASIDEESRLIAKEDKDPNIGDREAALSFLENSDTAEDNLDSIELDDAVLDETMPADDELEVISSDDELETISIDDDILVADDAETADEVLEPIQETMEEFPEPGPSELAHINARQVGQKLQGSAPRQQFKVSAITFQDDHMRVTFDSGAYVDFDLSALGMGEERNFRLGVQNVSVTSTSEGYILEVDGMRLFHPKTSFPAAS